MNSIEEEFRRLASDYEPRDMDGGYEAFDRALAFLRDAVAGERRAEVVQWLRSHLESLGRGEPPAPRSEGPRCRTASQRASDDWMLYASLTASLALHELRPVVRDSITHFLRDEALTPSWREYMKGHLDEVTNLLTPEEERQPPTEDEAFEARLRWRGPRPRTDAE